MHLKAKISKIYEDKEGAPEHALKLVSFWRTRETEISHQRSTLLKVENPEGICVRVEREGRKEGRKEEGVRGAFIYLQG